MQQHKQVKIIEISEAWPDTYNERYIRGRNNDQSTDMTDQILHSVCPKFSVITEMTSYFFLEQLEKISLEIPWKSYK